ncbi:MAG: hypothetical protein EHM19_08680, partial [Candidatus Latescibacterota bacterium]
MMAGETFVGLRRGDTRSEILALYGDPPPDFTLTSEETRRMLLRYPIDPRGSEGLAFICDLESLRVTYASVLAEAEAGAAEVQAFLDRRCVAEPLLEFLGKPASHVHGALGVPDSERPRGVHRYRFGGNAVVFECADR